MICLGLSPLERDPTVALLIDGQLVCVVAKERLSQQQQAGNFPYQAVEMALRTAGVNPREIDRVAYAAFDARTERNLARQEGSRDWQLNRTCTPVTLSKSIQVAQRRMAAESTIHKGPSFATLIEKRPWWKRQLYEWATADGWLGAFFNQQQMAQRIERSYLAAREIDATLISGLCEFGLANKLEQIDRHRAQATSAFYGSGFDRALVVTLDDAGSGCAATISIADKQGIQRIDTLPLPYSLGRLLTSAAAALGLPRDGGIASLGDLAAYGDPEVLGDVLRTLIEKAQQPLRWRRSSDAFLAQRLATYFRPADVAAAYQAIVEELLSHFVEHYLAETGLSQLVLTGEVLSSTSRNLRLLETPNVARIYIHPHTGIGAAAAGAAMLIAHDAGDRLAALQSACLGPSYAHREMHAALSKQNLAFSWRADIAADIARLLAENHTVARFQGPLEIGPESLGNRAILAPATNPKMKDWLVQHLRRPPFAQLGCAALAEDAPQLFEPTPNIEFDAQFKSYSFRCTPQMHDSSPAAMHIDGTARAQWVTPQSQPDLHRILQEYKQRTGLSALISTNLSRGNEPLACSPHQALRVFLASEIDYLAMGDFLIAAPQRTAQPVWNTPQVAIN